MLSDVAEQLNNGYSLDSQESLSRGNNIDPVCVRVVMAENFSTK